MGRCPVRLFGLAAACLLGLPSGCRWSPPSQPKPWEARRLSLLSSSRIYDRERFVGHLREFDFPDPVRPARLWLVENEYGQWIGWIDAVGRAFKLEPHERGGRHLVTGSLSLCVQALFGLGGPPRLSPEALAEAP